MNESAGILLFKRTPELQFLLVHPGGPFFARKDAGFWTIPKGAPGEGEDCFAAAQREFFEETGYKPSGHFIPLSPVVQKGGKKVYCWAVEDAFDLSRLTSNTFEIEWPPRSGKKKTFPEIDKAGWFNFDQAVKFMNGKQTAFLAELVEKLNEQIT